MDDTKKALLSIELDTAALTQNADKAKETIKALAEQLKDLKEKGKESGEAFDKITEQLKKAGDEAKKSKDLLNDFGKSLSNNTKEGTSGYKSMDDSMQKTLRTIADLDKKYSAPGPVNLSNQIKDLVAEYNSLSVEQRKNETVGGQLENRITKLKAQQLGLTVEQLNNSKVVKNGTDIIEKHRAVIDQVAFSTQKSKTAISVLTNEYLALSESQRKNADIGGKLNSQIQILQANTKTMGGSTVPEFTARFLEAGKTMTPFSESIGKASERFKTLKDGVSNIVESYKSYKTQVDQSITQSGVMTSNAGILAKGYQTLKSNFDVATGGVANFGRALIATPIGAIVTALSMLIDYLKTFQPIVDKVDQVMAGFNGAIAAGKHMLDEFFGSIHSVGDLMSKLGNILAHPIDSLMHLGKTMGEAAIKTYDLKKAQQHLDEQVKGSAVKSAETEAKIAELKVLALTTNLAKRREYQKEIKELEDKQTTDTKHNAEQQITITVNKVKAISHLTDSEIGNIRKLDEAKIEALAKSRHLDAESVKSLRDAVGQMAKIRKDDAEKILKNHTDIETHHKTSKSKISTIDTAAKDAKAEILASQQRMELAAITDATARERAVIINDFDQRIKAAGKYHALAEQLAKEKEQKLKALDKQAEDEQKAAANKQLADKKAAYDHDMEAQIEAAGKNYIKVNELKKAQIKEDLKLELSAVGISEEQKSKAKEKALIEDGKREAAFLAAQAKAAKSKADADAKLNQSRLNNSKNFFSQLQSLFGKNTIASKAAFLAEKAIAAAEIIMNTQRQISAIALRTAKATAADAEYGPVAGAALAAKDIAWGVVDTVIAIATGAVQLATVVGTAIQGFAKGGMYKSDGYGAYVTGPGNGTSDSINARLSNGESIINARSTQMFAPVLSAINQAGGGRAFTASNGGNAYALGGLFDGSNALNDGSNELATARAFNDMARIMAANMPRQVLVVEEVQASLQNKVMLNNMSNF